MRLYLDACCFNRPFDDSSIDRNHLEAEAVITILSHVQLGHWELVGSDILRKEISAAGDPERRAALLALTAVQGDLIEVGQTEYDRSNELLDYGFRRFDALHIACAESAKCDVMLTTDDRLLSRSRQYRDLLQVNIRNPLEWLMEQRA